MHHNLNSPHRNYGQTNLPWSANQNTIRSLCLDSFTYTFCSAAHSTSPKTLNSIKFIPFTKQNKKCSANMTTTTAAKKPVAYACLVYFSGIWNLYVSRIANLVYLSVYMFWLFVSFLFPFFWSTFAFIDVELSLGWCGSVCTYECECMRTMHVVMWMCISNVKLHISTFYFSVGWAPGFRLLVRCARLIP